MREFKFRAFHPDWHEMVYTQIPVDPYYEDMIFGKRAWCPFVFEIGTGRYPHGRGKGTVIMEWTGKEDIHGIDIYEGDRLQPKGRFSDYRVGVVTWYEDACQFLPHEELAWDETEWEIVGNIWETD